MTRHKQRKGTGKKSTLKDWIARHRLDAEALRKLEQSMWPGIGHPIDMTKLADCAKAVLINERIDGATPWRSYQSLPCETMEVDARDDRLVIIPADFTPTSECLVREALAVAQAFSGKAAWQIAPGSLVGTLDGATARARKAAVRFLRIAGARVRVSVTKTPPDPPEERVSPDQISINAQMAGQRARALIDQADELHGPAAESRYAEAERVLLTALQVEKSSCAMLCDMGRLRLRRARAADEQHAFDLLTDAIDWFKRALSTKADFFMAWIGRGDARLEISRQRPQQREIHLANAIADYEAALRIREDLYLARIGLGNAYLEDARWQDDDQADRLLMDAEHEFELALAGQPSLYRAQVGLGDVFVERAKRLPFDEAEALLTSAWHRYQQALQLRPSLYTALCGCADVELERARRAGSETEASPARALALYERALAIQPNSYRAASGRRAALEASGEWAKP